MSVAATTDTVTLPGVPVSINPGTVVDQMVRRASSMGFESWWRRAESVGFCAHPIQLAGTDEYGRDQVVWTRCNNRRAQVCPSCSDLYARDTWQLVHAGTTGGRHGVPASVAGHPQVFITLTAPSFGPVHTAGHRDNRSVCRERRSLSGDIRCQHGKPLFCNDIHQTSDEKVGQPICAKCYNYVGHVLFTWHLPELWRRFTIALRRTLRMRLRAAGVSVDAARVSFVKVVELQARLIPHIHALIRLDPHETDAPNDQGWQAPITATELASIIQHAARTVTVTVDDPSSDTATRMIRFGAQVDTQPVIQPTTAPNRHAAELDSVPPSAGRQVARYLAKYVTKSLADVGISARRISAEAIPDLDVSAHVRTILTTIAELAGNGLSGIGRWLHTLGYRGHITSKSRRYSTTMTALRERRATWTRERSAKNTARQHNNSYQSADIGDSVCWEFDRAGHASIGDRTLIISAAQRTISQRRTAREQLRQHELQISQGWRGDG